MLATDLDGTFVGDKQALQGLLNYYQEASLDVALVYITGRHFDSASDLIASEGLPKPDILVTDVGTAIYSTEKLEEDQAWKEQMQTNWYPEDIIAITNHFPTLKRQPLPDNRRISFTIDNDEKQVQRLETELLDAHIPHKLIYSSNRDIDILPSSSGKGEALSFVLQQYAKDDVQILIAGDSGNDIEMLSLGYPSVIVGNAQAELLQIDTHPQLYRAKKGYAGGIHEAWLHFYQ